MVLALGPVGCGFQPIYARSGGATSSALADQLAAVQVSAIEDRTGQQLRNNLVQALSPRGEPAGARYRLDVRLSETPQSMAVSKDGNATIGRVNMMVSYDLVDQRAGTILMSRSARAFSGYRYLGPRYASTVSEREAESTALSEIADEIRSALISYFNDPASYRTRQTVRPVGYDKTPSSQDSE
ncbi:MAG: LPS assembly lipoprotein LptE [Bacteroidales bacterium]